uniref:Uncharacterized protein n=1 Tax=Meloidogyne enterolobii TaxID=390850 RepID=A0A6V7W5M3_MELEN|nr:unnamed protein product [Meloidogyne enterolobii]
MKFEINLFNLNLAHDFIKTNIKNALKAKSKISKNLDGNHVDLRNQWEGLLSGGGEFKNKYDQFLAIVCTYNPQVNMEMNFVIFLLHVSVFNYYFQLRQKLMLFVMQIYKNLFEIRNNAQKNLEKKDGYA